MVHPLVEQLRFTRSEFARGLDAVTEDEGIVRFGAINSVSWTVGHLANHEQRYWFELRDLPLVIDGLNERVGSGQPSSTPSITEMWSNWRAITTEADGWLDTLTDADLEARLAPDLPETLGTMIQRVIYHYWYHLGEGLAARQMLGHGDLPQFVGKLGVEAPYRSA